jgi:Carbohydrate-selective porin, OprB family
LANSSSAAHGTAHTASGAFSLQHPEADLSQPDNATEAAQPLIGVTDGWYDEYEALKKSLEADTGFGFSMPVSLFGQWGAPDGGRGVAEIVYAPYVTWTPFTDTVVGSGTFTFAFQGNQFWTQANTLAQQQRIGLLAPPNGWNTNGYQYAQITYTHILPGNWLSVSVGQYSIGVYDGNVYAGSAQANFVNYALSWNGTQTYANAGTGAYLQLTPTDALQVAAGLQGATDVTGATLTTGGLNGGHIAYFVSAQWMPKILAGGAYSILYYAQPSVPQQPSASQGVSFSASQNITARYGVFLRADNASGSANPIETSVAFGGIVNNPFGRSSLTQVGLGFAWNWTNLAYAGGPFRRTEQLGELYCNVAVSKALQVTPDVQVYFKPALSPDTAMVAVFTLRTTINF